MLARIFSKRSIPVLVAVLLATSLLAQLLHFSFESHTLCRQHPGEFCHTEQSETTDTTITSVVAIFAKAFPSSQHEACSFWLQRYANIIATNFSTFKFLESYIYTQPVIVFLREQQSLYRLAPKNSPPHFAFLNTL